MQGVPFNSTIKDRLQTHLSQDNIYIPFYNVERNDIGHVAQRIKRNIENLKQIDIDKAPFNSKQERFQGEKVQSKEREFDSPEMVTWNAHH